MSDASFTPDSRFLQVNGLELHHLDWGTSGRPPLVLLHGIRLHAHCWSHFSRAFRGDYHVLALDARGHGDSAWSEEGHYSLHELYQDLHAILEERKLGEVTLIGHSLGARTAMLYTHLHPERVRRLVLVDMGAGLPPTAKPVDFSRYTETPPPKDFATHEEAVEYLGGILRLAPRELIEESVRFGMREISNGKFTWKYDPALSGPPRSRTGTREWDLWEAVKTIDCPTLLLHGEHSRVVTPEIAQRMASAMGDCRVELVEQAGHALFTDQPEAFAKSVKRFLAATHE